MLLKKILKNFFLGLKSTVNEVFERYPKDFLPKGVETPAKKRKISYLKSYELCKCRKCLEKLGESTKGVRKRSNKHCPFTLPTVTPPPSPDQKSWHPCPEPACQESWSKFIANPPMKQQ